MLYDPMNFLHSFATWAAAAAALTLSPAMVVTYAPLGNGGAKPWNLFLNYADESLAADPYAVLAMFPSAHEPNNPKVNINVQCAVIGTGNLAPWTLANSLFRVLVLDKQEHELRMVAVPGFKVADNSADGSWMLVNASTLNTPGQVGRDVRGRVKIVSNFSLGFYKVS